ncbi:hypothetical protein [Butyrivibrio sp. AE3009]|uniref:hypothetical protein n=1 Tax=Butyrivibrio sp. AE3009 TaxID=1280666 RepID=UPI0003B62D10|nr:hypothetical protein [Butyrivibrio sp. AE3009]
MKGSSKYIKFIALVLALVVTFLFADRLLSFKTIHGIRQARDLYVQPRDTIDVAFLGSSHVHYDMNTAYLWENFGIASYDYSAAEQPLWITYYYLQELCKYQSPGLVVLDLYSPASFHDEYQYYYLTDNLNGVRFSKTKLDMIMASAEPDRIWDFFPSFVTWHLRYKELNKYDLEYLFMSKKERQAFKGFTPHFRNTYYEVPYYDFEHVTVLPPKTEEYLLKIIDYCKDNGIELYLVVNPYYIDSPEAGCYNRIKEIAAEQGVRYENFNHWYDTMGLDFATDLNDASHLNYEGSCKYSDFLGQVIKSLYDIPDRRGDERYESWDRHAEYIRGQVERQDSEDVNENN